VRSVRANLPDFALVDKVLALEFFLHVPVLDFFFFLVGVHGEEYIRVALNDIVSSDVDWLEVVDLVKDGSQVLNSDFTCLVPNKEKELSCLLIIVRVDCRDRRLLLDVLKVAPG